MLANNDDSSQSIYYTRSVWYSRKQNKHRGSYGVLKLKFYQEEHPHFINSLIVNICMNFWAIFADESYVFEGKEDPSADETKRLSKFVPSDISFVYSEVHSQTRTNKWESEELRQFHDHILKAMPKIKHNTCVNKNSKVFVFLFSKGAEIKVFKSCGEVGSVDYSGK